MSVDIGVQPIYLDPSDPTAGTQTAGTRVNAKRGAVDEQTGSLVRDRVRAELRDWRISPGTALFIFLAPLAGALVVALLRLNLPAYRFVTGEDSVLEWGQFVLFLAGGVAGLLVARRLRKEGMRAPTLAYVLFGLGCIVVAGEEISWGQRLLGFGTPEGLQAINMQQETTAHNIGAVRSAFHGLELALGLYGSAAAVWIRVRIQSDRNELVELLVPPLFLSSSFFLIFAFRLIQLLFFPPPAFTVLEFGEWPELCFAFALAAFPILTLRRLARVRESERAPARQPRVKGA